MRKKDCWSWCLLPCQSSRTDLLTPHKSRRSTMTDSKWSSSSIRSVSTNTSRWEVGNSCVDTTFVSTPFQSHTKPFTLKSATKKLKEATKEEDGVEVCGGVSIKQLGSLNAMVTLQEAKAELEKHNQDLTYILVWYHFCVSGILYWGLASLHVVYERIEVPRFPSLHSTVPQGRIPFGKRSNIWRKCMTFTGLFWTVGKCYSKPWTDDPLISPVLIHIIQFPYSWCIIYWPFSILSPRSPVLLWLKPSAKTSTPWSNSKTVSNSPSPIFHTYHMIYILIWLMPKRRSVDIVDPQASDKPTVITQRDLLAVCYGGY